MADNYLERREEALRTASRTVVRRNNPSLDTLLRRNRSHRAFDTSYTVAMRQLETIVAVNTKLPSGRNAQTLRFKLLDAANGGEDFCRFLHLGGYLPELHLPTPGTEPKAFIIVCSRSACQWQNCSPLETSATFSARNQVSSSRTSRKTPWTAGSSVPAGRWSMKQHGATSSAIRISG